MASPFFKSGGERHLDVEALRGFAGGDIDDHGLRRRLRIAAEKTDNLGPVMAKRLANFAQKAMEGHAPLGKTGKLRKGIIATPVHHVVRDQGRFTADQAWEVEVVSTAPYSRDVDQGTGIFGPTAQKIEPDGAGALFMAGKEENPFRKKLHYRKRRIGGTKERPQYQYIATGDWKMVPSPNRKKPSEGVFAKSVKGQRGKDFFAKTKRDVHAYMDQPAHEAMDEITRTIERDQ